MGTGVAAGAGARPGWSRRTSARLLTAFALYCLLAVVLTWPLPAQLSAVLPHDRVDPGLNTWLIWWNGQSVPFTTRWWDAPQFYPAHGMLAVSEHLAGLALLSTPLLKLGVPPIAAYNVLFLLSFALSALAAHLLAHGLTQRHDAGLVAGLAFGFAPYRAGQLAHLQVLSAWPMPLVFLGLHLYVRTRRRRYLALFAGAWLLQALINGYFMVFVALLVLLWLAWFLTATRDLRAGLAMGAAWGLAALPLVPLVTGYARVHALQEFAPTLSEVEFFSADVTGWLAAAPLLRNWRSSTASNAEGWLYPGLTAPGLVLLAAFCGIRARRFSPLPGELAAPPWAPLRMAAAAVAALFGLAALSVSLFGSWRLDLGPLSLSASSNALHKPLGIAFTGLATALLASAAVRAAWRRRSAFVFYALATLVLWVFCLGPLARLGGLPIWDKAPYFWLSRLGLSALRVPSRFAMPAALCLAIAAALALVRLLPSPSRRATWLTAAAVVGLVWDGWFRPLPLAAPAERLVALEARDGAHAPGPVLELPLAVLRDPQALYRATFHGRPVVNGYGGREPRHYALLRRALAQGDRSVLLALTRSAALDVVVDRTADEGSWLRWMARDPRARELVTQAGFTIFRLPRTTREGAASGPRLRIQSVRASCNRERERLMLDGDKLTLWSSGSPQEGGEGLLVDLGEPQRVAAIVTWLGGGFVGYPRLLRVEASLDGEDWRTCFHGPTAGFALLGCVEAPLAVPLRVAFPPVNARHLRLTQLGHDRVEHWAVAELELRGPQ